MGFNYGLEKKNFDRQWAIMRKQYEDAGMSIEVIQAMYEYDWSVFNAARSYQNHTQEIAAPSFEQGEETYSPLMNKYQEAISVTEHYRETKSRFTWIGEIEDERLLSALENLLDADLELITLYAYEEYDTVEISRTPHPGGNEPGRRCCPCQSRPEPDGEHSAASTHHPLYGGLRGAMAARILTSARHEGYSTRSFKRQKPMTLCAATRSGLLKRCGHPAPQNARKPLPQRKSHT